MQLHPEHSKYAWTSREQAVTMGSAHDAARSGSHPLRLKKRQKQTFTNSSPMGLSRVAAALKGPVITPGGYVGVATRSSSSKAAPNDEHEPSEDLPGRSHPKVNLKEILKVNLKDLERVHRHKTGALDGFFSVPVESKKLAFLS